MIRRGTEVSMREIATALGASRGRLCRRSALEGWPYREVPAPGLPQRLYEISALPADIRERFDTPAPTDGASSQEEGEAGAVPASLQGSLNTPLTTAETSDKMSKSVPPGLLERYESLPESRRAAARAKLAALDAALAVRDREGIPLRAACERSEGFSAATLMAAWRAVRHLPAHLRAAALADRRWSGRGRPLAAIDPDAWDFFKADYLRAERPPAAMCYRTLARVAASKGWQIPKSPQALMRRLRAEVSPQAVTLARRGREALDRMRPAQIRDRTALDALEAFCADGHRFDTRVDWGKGEIGRPLLVAWQDIAKGKLVGWRIGREETSEAYRLSLCEALWRHGAPRNIIVDNGRGIASKRLTGGTPTRYRGRVLESDPVGLLTQLVGPEGVHWATPYSGQSKPIERAFKDLATDIAKDPRLAGAYTGKDTLSKPHNYGRRAIPIADFRAVCADMIAQHNAREGRRGLGMEGRSFDQAFEDGLEGIEVRQVPPSELARWLFDARVVTARASDGAVAVHGTRYWSEDLATALAGKAKDGRQVVVRYDPERLDRAVLVEDAAGRLLARAEPLGAVEFFDRDAAERNAKAKARLRKAARAELDALAPVAVGELLAEVAGRPEPEAPPNVFEMEIEIPGPHADPGREEEEALMRAQEARTLEMAGIAGGGR